MWQRKREKKFNFQWKIKWEYGKIFVKGRVKWLKSRCQACLCRCLFGHLASEATEENRRFFEVLPIGGESMGILSAEE